MLRSLSIKNYLLIENLEIIIPDGFNVLTGETGAGKSIIIDALGLILGNRLNTGIQISGDNKCIIEACFDIADKEALRELLHENDIDDEKLMIVRREILKAGKSRAFINDTPVTLQFLEDVTSKLVDLHNQFANLEISKREFRLGVVDSVAGTRKQLLAYRKLFREYDALTLQLNKKKQQYENIAREIDFYEFQLNQMQETGVKTNAEFEELESEANTLVHAGEIKNNVFECVNAISKDENNIIFQLKNCIALLNKVSRNFDKILPLRDRLDLLLVELKDVGMELDGMEAKIEINPQRLEFITQQIDKINSLFIKFRVNSVDEMRQLETEFKNKIDAAFLLKEEITEMQKVVEKLRQQVENEAADLSGKRAKSFAQIMHVMVDMLQSLNLKGARFEIAHKVSAQPDINGKDSIDFLFSANKNMPPENLLHSASGGELSRIMLCLKSLMSAEDAIPTLIFDEIDAGVSGEIAAKMGIIMHQLSAGRQVISITHLPQIAARGTHHFKVLKTDRTDKTVTSIKLLNIEERTEELACMLSGSLVTPEARANAQNLLKEAL